MLRVWFGARSAVGQEFEIDPQREARYRIRTGGGSWFQMNQSSVRWVVSPSHPRLLGVVDEDQQLIALLSKQ
jgi:hypothetical protein